MKPVFPIGYTSCHEMFAQCRKLKQLDLSSFNSSDAVSMEEPTTKLGS